MTELKREYRHAKEAFQNAETEYNLAYTVFEEAQVLLNNAHSKRELLRFAQHELAHKIAGAE